MTDAGRARLGKRITTSLGIALGAVTATVLLCGGVLLAMSPGRVTPFTDDSGKPLENSLAEKRHVEINGVDMGMVIKSKDLSNPVLLFVHGGPGMPEYFLTEDRPTGLEDLFTVVYWDQRGAGLSYSGTLAEDTLSVDQYVEDTIAVTTYLQESFGQDRIYLMAHSWGTYFAIQAVREAPQLYHAYIAVAQVTDQNESERLAHQFMVDHYSAAGDKKILAKLQKNNSSSDGYRKIRDDVMHRAGIGTTHDMTSVVTGVFLPSLKNREYTVTEKVNLWRGKIALNQNPRLRMSDDLRSKVTALDVPTYFFSGAYDYTANHEMSEQYLKQIEAPVKGFYLFKGSAHSPIMEEPDKVAGIIRGDVFNRTNDLADTR